MQAGTTRGTGRPLLSVTDLRVTFGGEPPIEAVRGITYEVAAGEAVGIVGESGSGKSVSVLALLGLLPPYATVLGSAVLDGEELIDTPAVQRIRGSKVGLVLQDPMSALNPVRSIGRQVTEALTAQHGIRGRAARERAVEMLGMVGIPQPRRRLDQYPHEFSGGMRQRVMIAAALICEPALLIADEPTTALDVTVQAQILELLLRLREELGMSLILITHDLGVVAGTVDRVHVMYAGRIVESGTTSNVLRLPAHPYTRGLLRSVPRLDSAKSAELQPISGRPPDLSDSWSGCAFEARCDVSIAHCRVHRPPLLSAEHGGCAACWLVEENAS
jgi:oligopeptide/dipeptide ABC transporter ATP-binding protein